MTDRSTTLVVVPTLDEAGNIERLLTALMALEPRVEVLVVDDASADGTAEKVKAMGERDARIHIMERPGKLGMGTAYRDGFLWALERDYERIVQMDADLSHDPADVPRLLEGLTDADIVLGSRFCPGGRCVGWPRRRLILSRFASGYVRPILGLDVKDPMGGFKAYRRATLERIGVERLGATGFVFQSEILHLAVRAGLSIREIPITFRDRDAGDSKMSRAIILEAMTRPFKIRRDARLSEPPARAS